MYYEYVLWITRKKLYFQINYLWRKRSVKFKTFKSNLVYTNHGHYYGSFIVVAVHLKDELVRKKQKYKSMQFDLVLNYKNYFGLRTVKWTSILLINYIYLIILFFNIE